MAEQGLLALILISKDNKKIYIEAQKEYEITDGSIITFYERISLYDPILNIDPMYKSKGNRRAYYKKRNEQIILIESISINDEKILNDYTSNKNW